MAGHGRRDDEAARDTPPLDAVGETAHGRQPLIPRRLAGNRWGGSIIGAQFLKRFVDAAVPWAHIDIAGVTWTNKGGPTTPKGGVGFGVRLLDRLVASYEG